MKELNPFSLGRKMVESEVPVPSENAKEVTPLVMFGVVTDKYSLPRGLDLSPTSGANNPDLKKEEVVEESADEDPKEVSSVTGNASPSPSVIAENGSNGTDQTTIHPNIMSESMETPAPVEKEILPLLPVFPIKTG